jgi:hypothetical protein
MSGELILLTKPTFYPSKKLVHSSSEFMAAWGGDPIWWEGKCKTAGTFFFVTDVNSNCEYEFPSYVFTKDYTLEDFRKLRDGITRFQKDLKNDSLDEAISRKFDEMRISFIKNNPVRYYIIAPLLRMKHALIKSGGYYLDTHSLFFTLLKIFQSALYLLPLIFGGIGLLLFGMLKPKNPMNILMAGLFFSLSITLTMIFKVNEWRYFIHIYPVLVYYLACLIVKSQKRFLRKNLSKKQAPVLFSTAN